MVDKIASQRPSNRAVGKGGAQSTADFKQDKITRDRLNGDAAVPNFIIGAPTGGNKGSGSLNAETIYLDGAELTSAATTAVGTADGDLVQVQAGGKLPALDGSDLTGISSSGRLIAGTPLIQNPSAVNTHASQAHGLGQIPDHLVAYLECLTAELGYSVGDRVYTPTFSAAQGYGADATDVFMSISNNTAQIFNKSSTTISSITAANWKRVIVPYKLS